MIGNIKGDIKDLSKTLLDLNGKLSSALDNLFD